jgi:hypothetical protein
MLTKIKKFANHVEVFSSEHVGVASSLEVYGEGRWLLSLLPPLAAAPASQRVVDGAVVVDVLA